MMRWKASPRDSRQYRKIRHVLAHLNQPVGVGLHVLAAAQDAVHHDCGWGRALTHLLLTPSHQGPLNQLIGLHMVNEIGAAPPSGRSACKPYTQLLVMQVTREQNSKDGCIGICAQPEYCL